MINNLNISRSKKKNFNKENCKISQNIFFRISPTMSKAKSHKRTKKNLTREEELSEQSKISIRTIQRIESGTEPKGIHVKITGSGSGNRRD